MFVCMYKNLNRQCYVIETLIEFFLNLVYKQNSRDVFASYVEYV